MRSRGGDGQRAHIERERRGGRARVIGGAGSGRPRATRLVGEIVRVGRRGGGKRQLISSS